MVCQSPFARQKIADYEPSFFDRTRKAKHKRPLVRQKWRACALGPNLAERESSEVLLSGIERQATLNGGDLPPYFISVESSGNQIADDVWTSQVLPAVRAKLKALGYIVVAKQCGPSYIIVYPEGPFKKL